MKFEILFLSFSLFITFECHDRSHVIKIEKFYTSYKDRKIEREILNQSRVLAENSDMENFKKIMPRLSND